MRVKDLTIADLPELEVQLQHALDRAKGATASPCGAQLPQRSAKL
jgi:hypothetical protein